MPREQTVTVYSFHVFEHSAEVPRLVDYKAPGPVISALGGWALPGTEQEVHVDELDAQGVYRRKPTGWGALDA